MNRYLPMILAALLIVLGGAYYLTQTGNEAPVAEQPATEAPATDTATSEEPAAAEEPADEEMAATDGNPLAMEMAMGDPGAPVTVIEYGSFTCPHCANWHKAVFKQLKANYIDTGKVRFIHREVYFDRFGLWAGMVARCGGEMRYFGLSSQIYLTQKEWLGDGEPATVLDNLRRMGRAVGLTDEALDACLNDEALANELVEVYQANAEKDEIRGTPTFVINGEVFQNMGYEDFAAAIDAKLAE